MIIDDDDDNKNHDHYHHHRKIHFNEKSTSLRKTKQI